MCVKVHIINIIADIKYFVIKRLTPTAIKGVRFHIIRLLTTEFKVEMLAPEFKRGGNSILDGEGSGHPEIVTMANVVEIHSVLL